MMSLHNERSDPSWPSEVPQDEHLDSDDDSVHEDYTIPYDQYLATKESQDVPTEASPIPPTAAYMLQTLTDLTTQVEGHRKEDSRVSCTPRTLNLTAPPVEREPSCFEGEVGFFELYKVENDSEEEVEEEIE
nr:hypothetical protein [Tanacetum cinerariifolium]